MQKIIRAGNGYIYIYKPLRMRKFIKRFKVPPGYLKAGDLIKKGDGLFEFVEYLEETPLSFSVRLIRQTDKKLIEGKFMKSAKVEITNDHQITT